MTSPKGLDWYRRPEMILSDLLRQAARGDVASNDRHIMRATVLAVDPDGGRFENPKGQGSFKILGSDGRSTESKASVGPTNPVGSVKARILTDGLDRLRADQEARVFWPLFPQDQLAVPISPGEHVYVMFEGLNRDHGLWISRVSGHESAGALEGSKTYVKDTQSSAMDNFEEAQAQYPLDDAHASLAPTRGAMASFEKED